MGTTNTATTGGGSFFFDSDDDSLPSGVVPPDRDTNVYRRGRIGIGIGTAQVDMPLAVLDVAVGTRAGVHPVSTQAVAYGTSFALPTLPVVGGGGPFVPPAAVFGVATPNGQLGTVLAANGVHQVGVVRAGMAFWSTGEQFAFGFGNPAAAQRTVDYTSPKPPTFGDQFRERFFAPGVQLTQRTATVVTDGVELGWEIRSLTASTLAMRLFPTSTAGRTTLAVGENVVIPGVTQDLKISLLNGNTPDSCFGFSVNVNSLRYQAGFSAFHRWYAGANERLRLDAAGALYIDPLSTKNSSGWGGSQIIFGIGSGPAINAVYAGSQKAGAGPNLNGLEFGTNQLNRMVIRSNGRIWLGNITRHVSDADAGLAGVLQNEIYGRDDGSLWTKL